MAPKRQSFKPHSAHERQTSSHRHLSDQIEVWVNRQNGLISDQTHLWRNCRRLACTTWISLLILALLSFIFSFIPSFSHLWALRSLALLSLPSLILLGLVVYLASQFHQTLLAQFSDVAHILHILELSLLDPPSDIPDLPRGLRPPDAAPSVPTLPPASLPLLCAVLDLYDLTLDDLTPDQLDELFCLLDPNYVLPSPNSANATNYDNILDNIE